VEDLPRQILTNCSLVFIFHTSFPQNHPAPRLPQGSPCLTPLIGPFPLPQRAGALRSTDAQHAHLDPSHAGGGVVTIAVANVELVGLGYGVRVIQG